MSDHYDKNWQVKYDDSEEKIIIYVKHPPPGFGICPLAELTTGGPEDCAFEDDMKRAKKMAAAPELLEAGKDVTLMLSSVNLEAEEAKTVNKLRIAIAKAEK